MNYKEITNDRQFKSATGLTIEEFNALSIKYKKVYLEIFGELGKPGSNQKIGKIEDTLFFILFQLKNDLVDDVLGAVFGLAGSSANRKFRKCMAILKATLYRDGSYPVRYFESLKEFKDCFGEEEEIIIDVEEQPVERPQDADCQKLSYSGKKKAHGEVPVDNEP